MASESIEILIEADNRASAKFKQVNKDMEASVKNIRDVGGKAKASTELVGTLANTLGGTALGGFAGELAMVTERVSAFSDVAREGGAGAKAFQVGLAGVVGVAGFQFGKLIGDYIFDTQRWAESLAEAEKQSAKLARSLALLTARRRSEEVASLDGLDADSRRNEASERQLKLQKELAAIEERQLANRKLAASLNAQLRHNKVNATLGPGGLAAGILTEMSYGGPARERLRQQLSEQQELLDAGNAVKQQLLEIATGVRDNAKAREEAAQKSNAFVQGLRDELELLKATKAERFGIEAARGTANNDDRNEAIRLMQEREAILAKQEAQKQADKEREQAQQRMVRMQEQAAAADKRSKESMVRGQMSVINSLRMQAIELTHGKKAAQEFALAAKGFSKGDASALAGIMGALAGSRGFTLDTSVQATSSRLMTRGGSNNVEVEKQRLSKEQLAKLTEMLVALQKLADKDGIQLQTGGV